MVLVTVILVIALLLALVLVHEWGHFIVAKKTGCKVEEFGFGFPPRIASTTKNGTIYSLNLFPIGGFVKIEGENMEEQAPSATSFAGKSAGVRIAILSAGVIMNVVLAAVLLTVQSALGTPTIVTEKNASALTNVYTYILDVAPGSPAQIAGMQAFDRIVSLQNKTNPSVTEVQTITKTAHGTEIKVEIERQGIHKTLAMTPRLNPPEGQGALGVSLASTGLEKVPLWKAPFAGIKKTGQMLVAIVQQFWQLIGRLWQHGTVGENLTGPIGIAIYTNEVSHLGASYFLEFAALISLNLAIINILPIPALDGGRILFVLLESVFARTFLRKFEQHAHTVGFVALIVLMILITVRDIHRYF